MIALNICNVTQAPSCVKHNKYRRSSRNAIIKRRRHVVIVAKIKQIHQINCHNYLDCISYFCNFFFPVDEQLLYYNLTRHKA